jgi:hypothetical protein
LHVAPGALQRGYLGVACTRLSALMDKTQAIEHIKG